MVFISKSELIPNFDDTLPIKQMFQELIKAIHEIAEQIKTNFAILIDEMPPSFFEGSDYETFFKFLQDEYPLAHVFMAISPSGRNLSKPINLKFYDKEKVLAKQLRIRHRNSLLLSSFLIHLTYGYNKIKQSETKFQCLSPQMDGALNPLTLPNGDITLWYNKSNDISHVEVLEFLFTTYLPEGGQVLVSPLKQDLSQPVYDWCQNKKWDVVSHGSMTGSERDLVIAFADDNFGNLEILSRARKRLIIITRYWHIYCSLVKSKITLNLRLFFPSF